MTSFFQFSQSIGIEKLVLKVEEPSENYPLVRFSGKIPCPVCKKFIEFRMVGKKLINNDRGKLSWSLSNFQTHIKLHYKQHLASDSDNQLKIEGFIGTNMPSKPLNSTQAKTAVLQSEASESKLEAEIEFSDNSSETDVFIQKISSKISKKRKLNVISDDETELSGEAKSGALAGQSAPDLLNKMMP